MINKVWKDKENKTQVSLEIGEDTITLVTYPEVEIEHHSEIVELQTLKMYPPLNEEKVDGELLEDGGTRYCFKKGSNWERAKTEIVSTFDYWLQSEAPTQAIL